MGTTPKTIELSELLAKITPLPYETYATYLWCAHGNIATVSDPRAKKSVGYAPLEYGSKGWGEAGANLAYLAHACNQLPALVAALEDIARGPLQHPNFEKYAQVVARNVLDDAKSVPLP